MTDSPARLVSRLTDESIKTIEFFDNLTEDQWLAPVYSEGTTWKVRDILAHFVSAEAGHLAVIKDIVNGGSGSPAEFDVHGFNLENVEKLSGISSADLIWMFSQKRKKSIDYISGLSGNDLEKTGRHPFFDNGTVEDIIKLIYRHVQIHMRDIKHALSQTPRP